LTTLRFQSLQISGYKRFGGETVTLRVRGRTVAVLGHNESGKSSLLAAITHIGRNGFAGATEFTDRTPRPGADRVLSARFELEESDIEAVKDALRDRFVVGNVEVGTHWHVFKRASGERRFERIEQLRRDTGPRNELAGLLETLSGSEWDSLPLAAQSDEQQARIRAAMQRTAGALRSDAELLPEQGLDELTSLKTDVDGWSAAVEEANPPLQQLQQRLDRIESDERAGVPASSAARVLFDRIPTFVAFGESARQLPTFTPFTDSPSDALVNLLSAGGTTFDELASLAGQEDGREALDELQKQVNLRLEELFKAWSQRRVCSVIDVDTTGVSIIGRDRSAPVPDPPISQRSEGMRTFAALLAFLHAENAEWSNPPVLLVDEAELHLHYDAQADLVEVFERQELAQCVIYTTHSVGCLPEDLGLGLVVVEESGDERSRLSQSFWTGGPGLTPIMLALGATALSFTPARRVLIGEGAHEAILLPSLLRQARADVPDHVALGFQIVGGLSEVSAGTAARLEEEAGTVLYVVDNDLGGRATAAVLPEHVRQSGRVLTLGQDTDASCIEDFVKSSVLVTAVDEVLVAEQRESLQLRPENVPPSGRAAWLDERLGEIGGGEMRTRVAQAAVVIGAVGGLIEEARVPALRDFLDLVYGAFPEE
jgi:energy-coupling factor transporter ATP-binding protein EcfA2